MKKFDADGNYTASFECEMPEYVGKFGCKGELDVVAFVHGDIAKSAKRMVHNTAQATIDVISDVEYSYAEDMNIYPNPTDGKLNTEVELMTRITIFNTMGQVVYDNEVVSDKETIDMTNYQGGMYLLRITTENGVMTERVVR